MTDMLQDKVALITGGTSGIGRLAAIRFAEEGAKVVIAGRRISAGQELIELIKNLGGDALYVQTDVTQANQVKALVQKTVEKYGTLDCAFNNAGIGGNDTPLHQITLENWNHVLRTNLTSVFLCMKHEITQMLQQKNGVIVNNASAIGLVGLAQAADYSASKHAVVGLTRSSALDYAEMGIRINAICPGWVATELTEHIVAAEPERITTSTPMKRYGTAEEIANAAVWLCSDQSTFMTGGTISIDGGLTAQ